MLKNVKMSKFILTVLSTITLPHVFPIWNSGVFQSMIIFSVVLWILFQTQAKAFSICLTTFALFTLSNEDSVKATILEANLLNSLLETNLFKEMNSTDLESRITMNITKEISTSKSVRNAPWNWTCSASKTTCSDSLYLSYSFNKKLSLLTHRYKGTSIHDFFTYQFG